MTDPITATVLLIAALLVGVLVGRATVRPPNPKEKRARRPASSAKAGNPVELYVGNLPYGYADRDLRKLFSEHGEVASIRLIKNRSNGKSKGYGFVEMAGKAAADAAVSALNGRPLKGRKLVVNEAKSRSRGRR